jgi:hypothetical protein
VPRYRFKTRRSKRLLAHQHQLLLFVEQFFSFAPQVFALISKLYGCEVLARGKDETACQD